MTDPDQRARILGRTRRTTSPPTPPPRHRTADLHSRITELRTQLKTAEQTYRGAYRRATTTGLSPDPNYAPWAYPHRRPPPTNTHPRHHAYGHPTNHHAAGSTHPIADSRALPPHP